jgi:hypothetical protein
VSICDGTTHVQSGRTSHANGTRPSRAPRIAIRLPPLRFLSFSDPFTRQPPWNSIAPAALLPCSRKQERRWRRLRSGMPQPVPSDSAANRTAVARDLPTLVAPLDPLAVQWEPMGRFPVYEGRRRPPRSGRGALVPAPWALAAPDRRGNRAGKHRSGDPRVLGSPRRTGAALRPLGAQGAGGRGTPRHSSHRRHHLARHNVVGRARCPTKAHLCPRAGVAASITAGDRPAPLGCTCKGAAASRAG